MRGYCVRLRLFCSPRVFDQRDFPFVPPSISRSKNLDDQTKGFTINYYFQVPTPPTASKGCRRKTRFECVRCCFCCCCCPESTRARVCVRRRDSRFYDNPSPRDVIFSILDTKTSVPRTTPNNFSPTTSCLRCISPGFYFYASIQVT